MSVVHRAARRVSCAVWNWHHWCSSCERGAHTCVIGIAAASPHCVLAMCISSCSIHRVLATCVAECAIPISTGCGWFVHLYSATAAQETRQQQRHSTADCPSRATCKTHRLSEADDHLHAQAEFGAPAPHQWRHLIPPARPVAVSIHQAALADSAYACAGLLGSHRALGFPHAPRAWAVAIAADICVEQCGRVVSLVVMQA